MKITLFLILTAVVAAAQPGPVGPSGAVRPPMIKRSPVLNILDADQDGVVTMEELATAPTQLLKLDKNGDGKLNLEEAGMPRIPTPDRPVEEPPAPAPSSDELTTTLMMFDSNKNGKLEKKEVPERMQGMFELGDANHDGILTRDELAAMAEANRAAKIPVRRAGGIAFTTLDADANTEISADEIAGSVAVLKALDKNNDGRITEEDLIQLPGGRGRGPGGPGGPAGPGH